MSANMARNRPHLCTELDRCRGPILHRARRGIGGIWPNSAEFDHDEPGIYKAWPGTGITIVHISVNFGSGSRTHGRILNNLVRIWTNTAQTWQDSDRVWPDFDQIWRDVGQIWATWGGAGWRSGAQKSGQVSSDARRCGPRSCEQRQRCVHGKTR